MRIALAVGAITALCIAAVANIDSWIVVAVQPEVAVIEFLARVMR